MRAKAWLWVHNWWCATLCRWKRNEWTNPLQLKWSLYVQRTITPAIWVRMVKCFHGGVVTTFMTWLLYNKPVFSCVDGSGCFVCESYLWERDRLKSRESSHKCHVLLISGYKAGRPRFANVPCDKLKSTGFYGLLLLPLWSNETKSHRFVCRETGALHSCSYCFLVWGSLWSLGSMWTPLCISYSAVVVFRVAKLGGDLFQLLYSRASG